MESDYSLLAKMSEKLDFGAKSVETAHDLKKKYISEPYNFRHLHHVGLDTLNLKLDDINNNKAGPVNNTLERTNYSENPQDEQNRTQIPSINTREIHRRENVYQVNLNSTRKFGVLAPLSKSETTHKTKIIKKYSLYKMNSEIVENTSIITNSSTSRANSFNDNGLKDNASQLDFITEESNDLHIENNNFSLDQHQSTYVDNENRVFRNSIELQKKDRGFSDGTLKIKRGGSLRRIFEKPTKLDISCPYDFRHVAHVGFNDFFIVDGVKCETIAKIIEEAGVTRAQLEDPSTRNFIIEFLKKNKVSVMEEQEKQHFVRSKVGVSASVRVSTGAVNTPNSADIPPPFNRSSSLNENHFTRTNNGSKRVPPPKPPRLSLRKSQSVRVTPHS